MFPLACSQSLTSQEREGNRGDVNVARSRGDRASGRLCPRQWLVKNPGEE